MLYGQGYFIPASSRQRLKMSTSPQRKWNVAFPAESVFSLDCCMSAMCFRSSDFVFKLDSETVLKEI